LLLIRLQVIGTEPEFDSVIVRFAGVPGVDEIVIDDEETTIPGNVALPERFTVITGLSDALLYIVTEPEKEPSDDGENVMGSMMFPDAVTVSGRVIPVVNTDDDV